MERGIASHVPGASVGAGMRNICDPAGIVLVGVDYHCVLKGVVFDKAMDDLMDSYRWVKE